MIPIFEHGKWFGSIWSLLCHKSGNGCHEKMFFDYSDGLRPLSSTLHRRGDVSNALRSYQRRDLFLVHYLAQLRTCVRACVCVCVLHLHSSSSSPPVALTSLLCFTLFCLLQLIKHERITTRTESHWIELSILATKKNELNSNESTLSRTPHERHMQVHWREFTEERKRENKEEMILDR